jgi:transcriptional regulator with XRE-family HTH domain
MRLTEFGKVVRRLRMEYDLSLKDMAKAMNMGSSYLSALEYGERKLNNDHVERAVGYLTPIAKPEEVAEVRRAAAQSTDVVNTAEVPADARHHVAAFARRLQEGQALPPAVLDFLASRH